MNTTDTKDSIHLVQESFGRCLDKDNELFDKFYNNFINSSPSIAAMFVNTNMTKQKTLLRHGLNFMIFYSTDIGKATAESVLSKIKSSHSKTNLNIKPEYYPFWKNSLLKAIEATDNKFCDETKNAWDQVLNHGIQYIVSGY